MPPIDWKIKVKQHPGSTFEDLENEPDYDFGHEHHVGLYNSQDRKPGLTHTGDDALDERDEAALEKYVNMQNGVKEGKLLNFRDLVEQDEDVTLGRPENRSLGSRFVLQESEDYIKNKEEWPANIEKRKKEEEEKKREDEERDKRQKTSKQQQQDEDKENQKPQEEHEWKRDQGQNKHHEAYPSSESQQNSDNGNGNKDKSENAKLQEKYSPQEIALLRMLQWEKTYIKSLKQNDGKGFSPVKNKNRTTISIDEADQFSPDNWIPRSSDLIRLTGKHPLNAEANLQDLFGAGLVTPNELHYVRNHGAVPYLVWEFHKLEVVNIDGKALKLSMNELEKDFDSVNIPVALACDGNRRRELAMVRKVKGFNWGAAAVSCAYWKGPLLRDVLIAAGVPEHYHNTISHESQRYWVNFQGADSPSEGPYETCIPLQYAMDPSNDVLLAYEMNNVPLPPDHGYPLRLMIPGYVGGRCIKWLKKIWVSEKENDSHYHIWDNRVLPAFITEKDGEFAETLFRHPSTACNEQNLNSVIVKPAQNEKISLKDAKKGKTYRIEGYAYDGGGHEVQRVEISLDDGETWLYCIRKFPEAPIRHGNKFWSWLHWHIDVEIIHILQAKTILCRCFNVFKNTQPKDLNWNIMGMMNNAWYRVKSEMTTNSEDNDEPCILFRHPVEPGTGTDGWMKPSVENQVSQAKQDAGTPQKQFTRQEIEKHDSESDCWIVVDNKVYDATSVLSWHPGGAAAITGHAGKVHQETSDEFASIHDDFAYQKLKDCILGVVSDKAKQYIKQTAEARAKDLANSNSEKPKDIVLQKHRWVPVKLKNRKEISKDTRTYTFELPQGQPNLGLGTCQHVQVGFHLKDRMVIRAYTPTRPLLPALNDSERPKQGHACSTPPDTASTNSEEASQRDGSGTFDLTIKTYFPTNAQPGGALSNILDTIPLGEEVELRGPTGDIVYNGHGDFVIEGKKRHFDRVSLVLGGSGITPGYALIARVLLEDDTTEIRVVDANKSEDDILLYEELNHFAEKHPKQLRITHVLSHPSDEWKGEKGHVNEEIIKRALFPPSGRAQDQEQGVSATQNGDEGKANGEDINGNAGGSVVFLCGPPAMISKAALPALKDWGYEEEKNCFGF